MAETVVAREDLYDLIWTKPITQVAKDFGMSDVWISKACTKTRIPRPRRGYWAKLESGKKAPTMSHAIGSLFLRLDLIRLSSLWGTTRRALPPPR